jgi:hypothetical protein
MFLFSPVLAQENSDGPTDEKTQKTYKEALQLLREREPLFALGSFKKADKQDGGHCVACQKQLEWKDFVTQNEMNWPQYCDGGFSGSVAKLFGVRAIPHTFTIDADGVLQDEQIGDASIEGKLKKLLARARELQSNAGPAK